MAHIVNNVEISIKLKQIIEEKNISLDELAIKLSISKKTLIKNLNGKGAFTLDALEIFADTFDIPFEELIKIITNDTTAISVYETIAKGSYTDLKKHGLTEVCNKDIYGKVLVEYAMEYNNSDLIKALINDQKMVVQPYDPKASIILLQLIKYMLSHNLKDPMIFIMEYCKINKSFDSEESIFDEIFELINKDNILLQKLFIELVDGKRPIVKNSTWIRVISTNKLDNILNFYIKNMDLAGNLKSLLMNFVKYKYVEGLYILINAIDDTTIPIINDDFDCMDALIKTDCYDIISRYINKGFDKNLNIMINKAILFSSFEVIINLIKDYPTFDYYYIGKTTVEKNRVDVLDLYIEYLDQDVLDYLLSVTPNKNLEMLIYLINNNAKFNNKYLNINMTNKANLLIEIYKKGEGLND